LRIAIGEFFFVLESEIDERVRALKFEFQADVSAVIFDCARADTKFGGN